MVGESGTAPNQFKLENLLTEKQLHKIVRKYIDQDDWQLLASKVVPAAEGIAGFLGDHLKVTLTATFKEKSQIIHLFVKRMPYNNSPKVEFIEKNNFYKREMTMFQFFEEMVPVEGPLCYTKALLYEDSVLVLPDLSVEGYRPRPPSDAFDLPHLLVAASALARFHAAWIRYEANRIANGTSDFLQEFGHIVSEPVFKTSSWLRAAAKLPANLIKTFCTKYKNVEPDLENKIYDSFLTACDSMREYKETINVVNHKDLWANNIMFQYEGGLPANAILIDFQCIRYAPPAFDVMILLYLNTTKTFREQHEANVLHHYYTVFNKSLDEFGKRRVEETGYDRSRFLEWCEKGRMFGMVVAIGILPYALMEPVRAQQTYDDPATFAAYLEDRTAPVVAYANESPLYKERLLELAEEYVQRYMMQATGNAGNPDSSAPGLTCAGDS